MDEISFLKKLVEIYGPHGEEEEVSMFIFKVMDQMNFKTIRTPIGNVIGEIGAGEPVIFLCGHMDTVKGKLPVKFENNKLYGRGVVDAKSPLAALIMAAARFIKINNSGKIIVAAVVDEEGHSKGIRELLKSGIKADFAIFGEPSKLKYITIGYKGSLSCHIDLKTRGGHSSSPLINNAIEKAMELWMKIKKTFEKYLKKGTKSSITTQITGIKNMGIGNSTIWLNFRYPEKTDLNLIKQELNKIIEEYNLDSEIKINLIEDEICFPYYSDKKSKLVNSLRDSIKKITGENAVLITKLGTGDMNYFGNYSKTPTVTYGPGDPKLDHTEDEVIDIKEYLTSIDIIENCIKELIKRKD